MKKKLTICLMGMLATLTSCYQPDVQASMATAPMADSTAKAPTIKISGSTTISTVMEKIVAYAMAETNPNYKVDIDATGSKDGFKDLLEGKTDIAMSSHVISQNTKAAFRTAKMEYVEFLMAGDAFVFVVNVNNPVKRLTQEQLIQVFTGKISNWKSVGGIDAPIHVVSRDTTSGTYHFMKDEVLQTQKFAPLFQSLKSNEELFKAVADDPFSIGYSSFSSLDYSVEPLNVSFDMGKSYVSPRVETVQNLSYRLFRGLYLYYKAESFEKVKPLMEIVKADTTQKILKKNGYIPINHQLISHR